MKTLAIRGLVRPNLFGCLNNIMGLYKQFRPDRVLFCSWDSEVANLFYKLIRPIGAEKILYTEPYDDEFNCYSGTCATMGEGHWTKEGVFKGFIQTNNVLDKVGDGWVILTRPDLSIEVFDPEEWFVDGVYCQPEPCRYPNFNDQFSVADAETMRRVWGFPVSEFDRIIDGAKNPESAIWSRMKVLDINDKVIKVPHYELRRE
jgi:hypothetical protein